MAAIADPPMVEGREMKLGRHLLPHPRGGGGSATV